MERADADAIAREDMVAAKGAHDSFYGLFLSGARNPLRMMALVSRALEPSPGIVLKELGWKYGSREIETEAGARTSAAFALACLALARTPNIAWNKRSQRRSCRSE